MIEVIAAPPLSVVLPVYNGERFLEEAVASVLGQTFADFELIIIDDGSTDSSGAIAARYAAADPRVRLVQQPNRGLVATLNRGLDLARAPLVARMDADDICLPRRFEVQVPRFESRPKLAVVGGFTEIIDAEGNFLRVGDYPLGGAELKMFLERGCPLAHPTVILRKAAVMSMGGYRAIFVHCEDYDLWLRLHDAGYLIENIAEPVLRYRRHGGSVSVQYRAEQSSAGLVARLVHRMRATGLPDPLDGITTLDEAIAKCMPPVLPSHLEAELFVLRHNTISLSDRRTIARAVEEYRGLSGATRREPSLVEFLLRAARGLWAGRAYLAAARCFVLAMRCDPRQAAHLILDKVRRLILRTGKYFLRTGKC